MSCCRVVIWVVLSGSAGGDRVDVEELEDSGLQAGWRGHDRWRVGGRGDEAQPGERVEDESTGGSGGGAAGESGHRSFGRDRSSCFAFNEAEDQQCEADHRQEPATIGTQQRQPISDIAAHHERLRQERAELEALAPPDPTDKLYDTRHRVRALRQDLDDLPCGSGRWRGTEIGQAARDKNEAERQHRQAGDFAGYPKMSMRMRHSWRKTARQWNTAMIEASRRYDELAAPIQKGLETDLARAETYLGYLEVRASDREQWLAQHPELELRIAAIERELHPTPTIQEGLRTLQVEPPSLGREL